VEVLYLKTTYVLYGVAARDSNELVCQFFDSHDALVEFAFDLPGNYRMVKLFGVVPDDFEPFGHVSVMRVSA
jgi:hypothetical protein